MKHTYKLLYLLLVGWLLASCASQKRIWYLQDVQKAATEKILQEGQIRIKPFDRLTVVVNSRDPELAVPFNSFSSLNSLSGMSVSNSSTTSALQIRTVDENGVLMMPVIGAIEAAGKTRSELANMISAKIIEGQYINDPAVNVEFADMKFSVIGEVQRPGYYDLKRDKISIFDALAMAGDMTIYGVRQEVIVQRENNGQRVIEVLDLTSKEIYNSPAFYLQQNDVVYVKPNKYKAQSGEISQNRSFYISLVATAVSVATLIVTITRK